LPEIALVLKDRQEVSALKRFEAYKQEPQAGFRRFEAKGNDVSLAFHRAWEGLGAPAHGERHADIYDRISKALSTIVWTSRDVEAFCLESHALRTQINGRMGLFLSVLINNAHGLDFTLHLGLGEPAKNLGYMNTKRVEVLGDVGPGCGLRMIGGGITIHGNAGDLLGAHMEGGRIIVDGSCGDKAGNHMAGGEIHVHGDCGSVGEVERGKVFVGGKPIVSK
jgi:hypothetical protein